MPDRYDMEFEDYFIRESSPNGSLMIRDGMGKRFVLPAVKYKPGWELTWVEHKLSVWLTADLRAMLPDEPFEQRVYSRQALSKIMLLTVAEREPVNFLIRQVIGDAERLMQEKWLDIQWPEPGEWVSTDQLLTRWKT